MEININNSFSVIISSWKKESVKDYSVKEFLSSLEIFLVGEM
jgi:hypothetical protein